MKRRFSKFVALVVSATLVGLPAVYGQGKKNEPKLSFDVNLVLVTVTVRDPFGRIVSGLRQDNFILEENGKRQEITKFSNEDGSASVCIVFDSSGSMGDKIDPGKTAVTNFIKAANPQDEFCLIYFEDGRAARATTDFTNADGLQNKLPMIAPHGQTPLIDAVYLALQQMKKAQPNNRRAIIIISDGGDNHSLYNENDLKNMIRESDTLIYSIGIFDRVGSRKSIEEINGPALLTEITDMTGGTTFVLENTNGLEDVVTKIGNELRNQYVLGYTPNAKDWGMGKKDKDNRRKIKVKVIPPKGLPQLEVKARGEYQAPRRPPKN